MRRSVCCLSLLDNTRPPSSSLTRLTRFARRAAPRASMRPAGASRARSSHRRAVWGGQMHEAGCRVPWLIEQLPVLCGTHNSHRLYHSQTSKQAVLQVAARCCIWVGVLHFASCCFRKPFRLCIHLPKGCPAWQVCGWASKHVQLETDIQTSYHLQRPQLPALAGVNGAPTAGQHLP